MAANPEKKSSVGLLVVILLLAALGGGGYYFFFYLDREAPAGEMNRYHSKEMRCSIELPTAWSSQTLSTGTPVIMSRGPDGEEASVSMLKVPGGRSLEKIAVEVLGKKREQSVEPQRAENFRPRQTGRAAIAGREAWWEMHTSTAGGTVRRSILWALRNDEWVYMIECSAVADRFEGRRSLFERIAESLRFE